MARKELKIGISDGTAETNRDYGKVFLLREMPALRAEKWAFRALSTAARAGANIPDEIMTMGMRGIAIVGVQALLYVRFDDAEPLLDEMLDCISLLPSSKDDSIERPLTEDDIEEIATLIKLRKEILTLHMGFLKAGDQTTQDPATTSPADSQSTQTSPEASVRFSRSRQTKPKR